MDLKIVRKNEHITGKWSGGTTTELAIYPPNSLYSNQDFIWRISSATVDSMESDFTVLPLYNRILMVLEGSVELVFDGKDKIQLQKYDQNSFDGGIATKSYGKITDFNLMFKKGAIGSIKTIQLFDNNYTEHFGKIDNSEYESHCFCCYVGKLSFLINHKIIQLEEGDIVVINRNSLEEFSLEMYGEAVIINPSVRY